ncbi:MFS transporter [Nocardioides pocheonensis]|jgi:MFS family permease|uniref:MFS transporter n=1 Tax=Nocardioides pocheonensis TaxID=661485 RepID=A0A3N0GIY5_9ACTN|nr:MFS transporter [Nocardioides pocheonensis]RNM12435.1 MFS transporter [Nocardioides pocheonensis]
MRTPTLSRSLPDTAPQQGAGGRRPLIAPYPLLIALLAVALGVSGAPAPLYGVYQREWHLAPITTTLVFAVYAFAALGAVLVAGQVSDRYGRKPLLVGAAVAMVVGLVVFMTAQGVAALFVARALHGAAVGATVVAGSAALLDLRPHDGARTGHLTGIIFNVGMAVTILGASLLAQFGPDPLVTPYAVVGLVVLLLLLNLLLMGETHQVRPSTRIRLARPRVPRAIRHDFRFAVLGVMASWSVLGVYLSLFPAFAGQSTGIHSLVFGGAVVAAMASAAAVSQAFGARFDPRPAAIAGDFGTAVALVVSVLALDSHRAWLVAAAAVFMGLSFGLSFGGSLRHLGRVVPADHRGEVMSAYYVLAYSAMAVPTILAGWAATQWSLAAIFPWFTAAVALACLTAGVLGLAARRPEPLLA